MFRAFRGMIDVRTEPSSPGWDLSVCDVGVCADVNHLSRDVSAEFRARSFFSLTPFLESKCTLESRIEVHGQKREPVFTSARPSASDSLGPSIHSRLFNGGERAGGEWVLPLRLPPQGRRRGRLRLRR